MLQERAGNDAVTIIYLLIPLGIVVLVLAIGAFFWAVRSGQFDDMDTPAWRILLDDDSAPPEENTRKNNSK